jgi:hypothetical protein
VPEGALVYRSRGAVPPVKPISAAGARRLTGRRERMMRGSLVSGMVVAAVCATLLAGSAVATADRGQVAAFAPLRLLQVQGLRAGRAGVCKLGMLYDDVVGDFKEGESVKLKADTWFFHVSPKNYPDGKTVKAGTEGKIKKIILKPDCKSTPHRPIQVQFTEPDKFFAHMEKDELERA